MRTSTQLIDNRYFIYFHDFEIDDHLAFFNFLADTLGIAIEFINSGWSFSADFSIEDCDYIAVVNDDDCYVIATTRSAREKFLKKLYGNTLDPLQHKVSDIGDRP